MEPIVARKTWRTLEPIHGMIYFAPEAADAYAAVGLGGNRAGYFASRAAPMGAVPAEVVIATFFNFNPDLVRNAMAGAWAAAPPPRILEARLVAADRALRRALDADELRSPELVDAADLARRAANAACEHPEGRPLFAGHAALAWPDEPHLVLWHAQTLLREYRGDGHVALLTAEGLDGVDALVLHAATGEVPEAVLRASRAWPERDWRAAIDRLAQRGLLEPGSEPSLTEAGRTHRQHIEDRTDALALEAYEPLGDEGCARLRALARPVSRAVIDAGLLVPDPDRWAEPVVRPGARS